MRSHQLARHLGVTLFIVALGFTFTPRADASSSLTWTNPSSNEKLVVGATNGVDAVATSTVLIHVVQLYVNGCKMVEQVTDGTTAYLDQPWVNKCPFNVGNNTFTVQALDESSNVLVKQTRTVIGVSAAGGQFSEIEDNAANWIACNQCGGGGGGDPVPASNVVSPAFDTDESIKFTTVGEGGIKGSNATSYWYVDWGISNPKGPVPSSTVEYVKLDFEINIPSGTNASDIQAVEFETQQKFGGYIWNMAWQADYKNTGFWRIFDYPASSWQSSGIALSSTPAINDGKWHHITAEFHVDPGSTKVYHDALWIDGTRFAPHQNNVWGPGSTSATQMTNAFQLDDDKANDGITSYLDDVSVTYTNQ
jgi:hypothetical protein